ncbi:hypothetical protein LTR95_012445 [Oleoguttula sp. CCFEE 5521]
MAAVGDLTEAELATIARHEQLRLDEEFAIQLFTSGDNAGTDVAVNEDDDPMAVDVVVDRSAWTRCVVCDHHGDNFLPACSHPYCPQHLGDLFRHSMDDENLFPPRCCQQEISINQARAVLDVELVATFEVKCVCGHEFCYVCGGNWRPKTCACAQWNEERLLRRAAVLVDREQGAAVVPAARPRPRWLPAARRPAPRVREQGARAVREAPAARPALERPARGRRAFVDLMENIDPRALQQGLRRREAAPVRRRRRPAVDAGIADRTLPAPRVVEHPPQQPAAIAERRRNQPIFGFLEALVRPREPRVPVELAAQIAPPPVVLQQALPLAALDDQPPPAADPMWRTVHIPSDGEQLPTTGNVVLSASFVTLRSRESTPVGIATSRLAMPAGEIG